MKAAWGSSSVQGDGVGHRSCPALWPQPAPCQVLGQAACDCGPRQVPRGPHRGRASAKVQLHIGSACHLRAVCPCSSVLRSPASSALLLTPENLYDTCNCLTVREPAANLNCNGIVFWLFFQSRAGQSYLHYPTWKEFSNTCCVSALAGSVHEDSRSWYKSSSCVSPTWRPGWNQMTLTYWIGYYQPPVSP